MLVGAVLVLLVAGGLLWWLPTARPLPEVRIGELREEDEGVSVDVRFVFRGGPRETTLRLVDEDAWRLCDGAWVSF